jgi:hypothetical protein
MKYITYKIISCPYTSSLHRLQVKSVSVNYCCLRTLSHAANFQNLLKGKLLKSLLSRFIFCITTVKRLSSFESTLSRSINCQMKINHINTTVFLQFCVALCYFHYKLILLSDNIIIPSSAYLIDLTRFRSTDCWQRITSPNGIIIKKHPKKIRGYLFRFT